MKNMTRVSFYYDVQDDGGSLIPPLEGHILYLRIRIYTDTIIAT